MRSSAEERRAGQGATEETRKTLVRPIQDEISHKISSHQEETKDVS